MRIIGACQYLAGLLTPWRPAYSVSARPSRHRFFVTARDVVGRHISKYGAHEADLTAWIADHLGSFETSSGIVVDVGANLGWHTVHAAKVASVQHVVAYEPDAFNAWLLDRNLEQNYISNTVVNVAALGEAPGTAMLHSYKGSNRGRHSLAIEHGRRSKMVPLVTLDSSLTSLALCNARILLMKIDVEGYEPAVLAGAKSALERTAAVITEFDPSSSLQGPLAPERTVELLHAAKFEPHVLLPTGLLGRADLAEIRKAGSQIDLIWLAAA